MDKFTTVTRVMESLVKLNNWTVKRFDVHYYNYGNGIEGYSGYLDIKENPKQLVIRGDGSFEFID